jgi:hypothetical protein
MVKNIRVAGEKQARAFRRTETRGNQEAKYSQMGIEWHLWRGAVELAPATTIRKRAR